MESETKPGVQDGVAQAAAIPFWSDGETWLLISRICLALAVFCFLGWMQQRSRARLERRIAEMRELGQVQDKKGSAIPRGHHRHSRRR